MVIVMVIVGGSGNKQLSDIESTDVWIDNQTVS